MSRPHILAFSFFPAYVPPQNGGVERLYRLYRALSEQFDVTLISSGELNGVREEVRHGTWFREIRIPKDQAFAAAYQSLDLHGSKGDISGPAIGIACETFGSLHEEYLRHHAEADVIIHDSPFLVQCDLFRGFDGKPRIYNSYNFETGLYRTFEATGGQASPIAAIVERLERELCGSADLITVCSREDQNDFERQFKPAAAIETVPNGIIPPAVLERFDRRGSIIFVGSNHKPNNDAAAFIVDELAPKLPNLTFEIVGSCHPPLRNKNVIAHGIVDSETKRRLLHTAQVAINPIASGSGSSLKVADFALNGLPIVSTELGVRGFGMMSGQHYVELPREDLACVLPSVLENQAKLAEIAENARAHIAQHYSWDHIAKRFGETIQGLLEQVRRTHSLLLVNDYDFLTATGGGATRTAGLCRGLSETFKIIFLCFRDDDSTPFREMAFDDQVLILRIGKTDEHRRMHAADDRLHWVSTADIVNGAFATSNKVLVDAFRCAAASSSHVICEHPYMVGLPRLFGTKFVYSSQNFEAGLKEQMLADHPRRDELLDAVRDTESYSCGASQFIVAVSEDDGRQLSANYSFTAPIIVIRNGSDGPAMPPPPRPKRGTRPRAVFIGSAHGPNVMAAQWIASTLAAKHPNIDFEILGSVSSSIVDPIADNVELGGRVDDHEKSKRLFAASIALNPMSTGSGSNVKIADYLQHGLKVLSTGFGARGYEDVPEDDLHIAELDDFDEALARLLSHHGTAGDERPERQRRYLEKLSMTEGGRQLRLALDDHSVPRRRALYVSYRYVDPPQGGGEVYVDRLVGALAASGWFVDVIAPRTSRIVDVDRFGSQFLDGSIQPVQVGQARLRTGRFPVSDNVQAERIADVWKAQPEFEEAFFRGLNAIPDRPVLAWGWAYPQDDGRWAMQDAGLHVGTSSTLVLEGKAHVPAWLQFFSDSGELISDQRVDGDFQIKCRVPAGFVRMEARLLRDGEYDDPRPLGVFIRKIASDGEQLTTQDIHAIWSESCTHREIYDCLAEARRLARDSRNLRLTELRQPSSELNNYVDQNIDRYDLLITHNAIFGSTGHAIECANKTSIPSVLVPHLHLDDDFYHFEDVLDACKHASITLACPSLTKEFLVDHGVSNARFFTPGVDADESFTEEDAAEFRNLLGRDEKFILILGRKAPAKGYLEIIRSVREMDESAPLIVMIGPDDDRRTINDPGVVYLGPQPRSIVRGALRECLALVNMSRSESFGIVLLEAGLAQKPVVANSRCSAFVDLVQHGINGYLTSPSELRTYLEKLLKDEAARQAMGEAGHRLALSYDWQRIEKEFVELCDQLAEPVS